MKFRTNLNLSDPYAPYSALDLERLRTFSRKYYRHLARRKHAEFIYSTFGTLNPTEDEIFDHYERMLSEGVVF